MGKVITVREKLIKILRQAKDDGCWGCILTDQTPFNPEKINIMCELKDMESLTSEIRKLYNSNLISTDYMSALKVITHYILLKNVNDVDNEPIEIKLTHEDKLYNTRKLRNN